MRKLVLGAALFASFAFATDGRAQPLGLGTSPQGTLTYAVGAAVAKVLGDTANMQSRVQPSSGTGAMRPRIRRAER